MGRLKKYGLAAFRACALIFVIIGAIGSIVGALQDVSGGNGLWSLTPWNIMSLAVATFVLGAAAIIVRHEILLDEVYDYYGNEHKRKLLMDGIPPFKDVYLQYIRNNDYGVVNRFWNAGIVNVDDTLHSDLHLAAEVGSGPIIKGIIERGGNPNRYSQMGITPLVAAASAGKLSAVDALLEFGAYRDAKSVESGTSALYAAAANGHYDVVRRLLSEGADVDSVDIDNITPLMAAMLRQKWNVASLLLESGASVVRCDAAGATVLDYALASGAPAEFVQALNARGAKQSLPKKRLTGSGHNYTGKVTPRWSDSPEKEN
jgi:ankyrin repeat protein